MDRKSVYNLLAYHECCDRLTIITIATGIIARRQSLWNVTKQIMPLNANEFTSFIFIRLQTFLLERW